MENSKDLWLKIKGEPSKQLNKFLEEAGELASGLNKNKKIKDIANELGCDQSLISIYKKRIEERGYIYGTK